MFTHTASEASASQTSSSSDTTTNTSSATSDEQRTIESADCPASKERQGRRRAAAARVGSWWTAVKPTSLAALVSVACVYGPLLFFGKSPAVLASRAPVEVTVHLTVAPGTSVVAATADGAGPLTAP